MKPPPPRRQALRAMGTLAAPLLLPGCDPGPAIDRGLQLDTLGQAWAEVLRLASAPQRRSAPGWSWPQVLVHCAQSIEYSMHGFPQAKPALFQATVGKAAWAVFSARGRMHHSLTEPIPGAPALSAEGDEVRALARLQQALQDFARWAGPLQPHFAYSAPDAPAYARAHSLHLAQHLSAFDA